MISSNFWKVDEDSLEKEKRCIGETADSRAEGLQALKKKILDIEDLNPRLDDEFLLRFLRVAKFDVKKAYDRLRKYYSVKKKYPQIFDNFYPSATSNCLKAKHMHASPIRAEDNSVVLIHKKGLFKPSEMEWEEMFRLDSLLFEFLLENPATQVCGVTMIIDYEGYGLAQFAQDTPRRAMMVLDAFQNSFPLRFKAIHIINAPHLFTLLYNVIYPFFTTKMRKRLVLHSANGDWTSLHSHLSPDILPEEYGGTLPKTDLIDLGSELVKKESFFKDQLQYGFSKDKKNTRTS